MDAGRRIVFVCGPYAAPTVDEIARNVRRAAAVGRLAVELGYSPIVPHLHGAAGLHGSPLDDGSDGRVRAVALSCSFALVRAAPALWVIRRDDGSLSPGTAAEREAWSEAGGDPALALALTWQAWAIELLRLQLLDALEGT